MRHPRADTPHVVKVSEYILESLKSAGCGVAFGLPGVHALGLWSAVENSGMRYVGFRHEQASAHAADGYARASGRPGLVMMSTGPGALNALSALAEAYVCSSPVFAVTSAIPTQFFTKGKGFLHESKDLQPAFQTATKFSARAMGPAEIPPVVSSALEALLEGRSRPVLIEVPADLFDAEIPESPARVSRSRPSPPAKSIEEAGMLLSLAARPVIWAGGGVLRSGASDELQELAEKIGAPVVTTFMGKGAIPEDHPLSVGTLIRLPEIVPLLRESDLMLAIGTRFSGMSTGSWKLEIPPQLIHIDIDEDEIGRNYPVRLGIVADAKESLSALSESLATKKPGASGSGDARAAQIKKAAFERAMTEGPREMSFLEAIRRSVDPEIHIVHDMTIPSYWAWPFLPAKVPGTTHAPYGYASLGFSFPAAIGVAAADPGQPVVAFSGDGGFQYHARELATVAENDLPLIAIVFNDRAWGILRSFSNARYGSDFGMELAGPDFPSLARAYGVNSAVAEEPEDLEKALREAVSSREPWVIEVPGKWEPPPPAEYYRR